MSTRYRLIPVTHNELRLFCKLGGILYLYASPATAGTLGSLPFKQCAPAEKMRRDIYLIGSTPEVFAKLSRADRETIACESESFGRYRNPEHAADNNARILYVCT